jgi:cytochrome c oxidase cbb3-type subunit 3
MYPSARFHHAPLLRVSITLTFALTLSAQTAPFSKETIEKGRQYFQQNCAFCHGRDAGGGESGPDLTRSKLVAEDVNGSKIGPLVRAGRAEKGMPAFNVSDADLAGLAAFVHTQKTIAESQKGGRRGVDVADLQTGNVAAGKAYFNGPGTCSTCHSADGDLAKIATKYEGLKLEERMLFPNGAKATVTVHLKSGEAVTGTLAYLDEFTVALKDAAGQYHSWPTRLVEYSVDDPSSKHADLLAKYSDDDIHNLMAYLQTLR